ncbi:MarR family winged helix-turn-helix transcriptional regulator [Actinocorallia populi]|uniref:MarR family winged helix-turn-helix transcriptional regulator n=1 Tax=Actinocorallia populi TaxID=2079200 RepID=UPI000D08A603|nr:MarR family transcriptional regulator [Actinocorallia populi]
MTPPADRPADPGAILGQEFSAAVVLFHEAVGRRLGLTPADHRALTLIRLHGPLTATALSRLTGLTPGAVTGLVDRLEHAGLARRAPDPADRRRTAISATGELPADVIAAFADLSSRMAAVTAAYDERELAAIADFIQNTTTVLRDQTRRLSS